VILQGDKVVLVERGREPLKGRWSLPGGVVEAGELVEDALRREVKEETGLEVKVIGLVEVFERIQRDAAGRPEYHYVLLDYLCEPLGGRLQAASDVARAEWVPLGETGRYPLTSGAREVIEKAFAMRDRRR